MHKNVENWCLFQLTFFFQILTAMRVHIDQNIIDNFPHTLPYCVKKNP
jgi:hypothetical protein